MEWSKKLFTAIVICALATTQLNLCLCITEEVTASERKQVFRLLAVEAIFGEDNRMKSGQYLISSLLKYSNWNNATDEYVSYIHLLSRYTENQVKFECRKYWRGNSTKENVHDEIVNFLGSASPGEIVIFYYNGHSGYSTIKPDERIESSELDQWLKSGGLTEAYVCVIFDACYSGSWINDGAGSSFGENKIVFCSSRSDQLSWAEGETVSRGWFTGYERTNYRNGTFLPLGVIGGFVAAKELNNDGWISFLEDFAFAKSSTEQYSSQENEYWEELDCLMNPVSYNGLPNEYDPPLVLIATHDVAVTEVRPYRSILNSNTSTSINVTIENQGDFTEDFVVTLYYNTSQIETRTVTLISEESRTLTFNWTTPTIPGNYTIKAVASQVPGETETWDNMYIDGTVTVLSPIMNFYATWEGVTYHVTTFSNSTVADFNFSQPNSLISFNVTGSNGTIGFCNVTIPKELLGGPYTVLMNDLPVSPDAIWTWNDTHSFIYFTYNHSTHMIQIIGATVVREFPSFTILTLFTALAIIAVALAKKIRCKVIAKTI